MESKRGSFQEIGTKWSKFSKFRAKIDEDVARSAVALVQGRRERERSAVAALVQAVLSSLIHYAGVSSILDLSPAKYGLEFVLALWNLQHFVLTHSYSIYMALMVNLTHFTSQSLTALYKVHRRRERERERERERGREGGKEGRRVK